MSANTNRLSFASRMQFLLQVCLAVSCAIFVSVTLENHGGSVEGRWFPVVTKGKLVQAEAVDRYTTRAWITAETLRTCQYRRVDWKINSYGDYTVDVPVTVDRDGFTMRRAKGLLGPWIVPLPVDTVRKSSQVYIVHRCHIFWDTRTQLFGN